MGVLAYPTALATVLDALVSTIVLDARGTAIRTTGDVTARDIQLKEVLPKMKPPKGSSGKVGGHARFVSSGNSVAATNAAPPPVLDPK